MNTDITLSEVARGREITSDELLFLMEDRNCQDSVIELADNLNRKINHDVVTFVHNRNINYTNICRNRCLFCAFRRTAVDEDSFVLSVDEILRRISCTQGITEVCLQGGISAGLNFPFILEIVQAIKSAYPDIHIHAFSPMEIKHFSVLSGNTIGSVLSELIECGLGSIPGTAAEILNDRVRQVICPEKVAVSEWVDIITTAHQLGLRSTATILIGHIETASQVVRHLEIIRTIQKKTSGFTELIPLIFIPYGTSLGRKFNIGSPISFEKVLKFYALSRIYLNGLINNIQASWPKLGLENAVKCLSAGVNDLGGTLYEENITRNAGGIFGQKVDLEEFREHILGAGKTPRLRDTLYNFLPDYAGSCSEERIARPVPCSRLP
jgi:7,8-didemethyl-8-hydroxy-5-deazariboflavin synthase CofH subunit